MYLQVKTVRKRKVGGVVLVNLGIYQTITPHQTFLKVFLVDFSQNNLKKMFSANQTYKSPPTFHFFYFKVFFVC